MSSSKNNITETPLMKQFFGIKEKHPDALLLFRVGDFYETFSDDAVKASQILGITLTKRANGSASHVDLAGFPYHSLDTYLPKLIQAGIRVAICEQLEDPKATKTIVQRGVTELISPGTAINDKVLAFDSNNYLACIHFGKLNVGLSLLELSTGQFLMTEQTSESIKRIIEAYQPSEVLVAKSNLEKAEEFFESKFYTYQLEDYLFEKSYCYNNLINHFKTVNLKGFGIEDFNEGIISAGIILHYLNANKHEKLGHITNIQKIESTDYIWLDRFTIRNLELIESNHPDGKSLFSVINRTKSPMGNRLLKRWIMMPLKNLDEIHKRQSKTSAFVNNRELRKEIAEKISRIGDLERLIGKIALQKVNPREVIILKAGLKLIWEIKALLLMSDFQELKDLATRINDFNPLIEKIESILEDEAPVNIQKGNVIKKGCNAQLDEWKDIAYSGKDYLLKIQKNEIQNTGITSLKIAFNNVFGYYLEVTNAHKDRVPQEWIRKQTLVNAERYITPELKDYEEKILQAESKIGEIEKTIFEQLILEISSYTQEVQSCAFLIAQIDCHIGLAETAEQENYCCPQINDGFELKIKGGRHPVIEKSLPLGEQYIANDLMLDNENQQIIIITGPNMSGKSAILRQTALIVLMAQIGGYVPCQEAEIGLIDKIFTRVGASDNLSLGESTFMVEMIESANILNNITKRSLIILDEIGRGTSTYDGISIAWSLTEYLHNHHFQPKTLFATHYHELNEINLTLSRIANFHVTVKEVANKIIFLRKLQPGGSEHSFGIHVAQLAGLPPQVIRRANSILKQLESQRNQMQPTNDKNVQSLGIQPDLQLQIFEMTDTVGDVIKREINNIDINTLTPIEALMKIHHIKNLLKKV